jgi:hypothetical protein
LNTKTNEKTETREEILYLLDKIGWASRTQIVRYCEKKGIDLGSLRNINRILKSMDKYLESFRAHENVYYLSKTGREFIASEKIYHIPNQVKHVLMRNDLYLEYNFPEDWNVEAPVCINGNKILVADVFFRTNQNQPIFAEIDNTQKMIQNKLKVQEYKALKDMGILQKKMKVFPVLVWYTTTEKRRKKLEQLCFDHDLKYNIYTLDDLN